MSSRESQTVQRSRYPVLQFLTLFLLTKVLTEGSFLQEISEKGRPFLLSEDRNTFEGHFSPKQDENSFVKSSSDELPVLRLPAHAQIYDVPLDRNDTLHIYWQVDYDSETVRMELHSKAISPNPWVAIGFSDRGEVPGSDLCVFWVDWKMRMHFENAKVDDERRLRTSASQACHNFRYRVRKGILKFTFTRPFDPCQPDHYVIERGTTHILWSWGEGPLYSLDGVLAQGDYHGEVKVELLKPQLPQPNQEESKELLVAAKQVAVPAEETTYWCSVQKLPENFIYKHHVLKFGPKIQKGNENLVHHMEVFHCEHPPDFEVPLYQEAGLPIGGEDFNQYVMLEVHYNNPEIMEGRIDSSGVVLTYSSKLRNNDAAIMELGLEYTPKMAIPPRMKTFVLAGYCIPECTALSLPSQGIYIFGSQLHTHLTGVRTWTKHYRGDVELPEMNRDNHYSTHFQEIRRLPSAVHILPGDSLVMACEYSTLDRANVTLGGFAISDEMCVNYVHYYPKVDLEVCKSSIDSQTLVDYFDFMHRLELQPTSPDLGWRDNYESIEWTPLRSNFLQNIYDEAPLSMQCNRSSGQRFPGYWENKPIPKVLHPLPKEERKCKGNLISKENGEIIIV